MGLRGGEVGLDKRTFIKKERFILCNFLIVERVRCGGIWLVVIGPFDAIQQLRFNKLFYK